MKKKIPSKTQMKIIDHTGNIVITARPGSGKTFTIVEKIKYISEKLLDYQGVIAISFTRKASNELEHRCKERNVNRRQSFYGTIDRFYISQIICPFAKHITRSNVQLEVRNKLSDYSDYKDLENIKVTFNDNLKRLLIQSLKDGHIFLEICGETAKFILDNVIDCQEYIRSKFTHIFIDEYQDCGDIQHQIFLELVKYGLIGIAVGDINQAIYAFSNRYSIYLTSLIKNKNFKHFEITKNHRCHKSISNYSLKLMGLDIKNQNEDNRVFKIKVDGNDENIMNSIDYYLNKIKEKYKVQKNNEIAILCRNNFTAMRASRFLKSPNKLFTDNELDRYNSYWARLFSDILNSYFDKNIYFLDFVEKFFSEEIDAKKFSKANTIVAKLFALKPDELWENIDLFCQLASLVYPDYGNQEEINMLKELLENEDELMAYKPASDDEICVMTLHKSKGLEFKIVFHMDLYKWILPNEGNDVTEEDMIQALNLHYVGITRAKDACYIMQGTKRYREKYDDYKDAKESPFLNKKGLNELRKNYSWNIPQNA